uniref:Suppressor APC domain containing 1 n=1 Tax=Acanthochromis polyacanthus TaxID=80966 RepID=A0A3Q1I1U0_9TELE
TELLSMACPSSGSASYTVVIIPLKTSLYSLDALRFYLWIKRLKDLEKEKDALCSGLEVLEKARLWYLQRLEENKSRQNRIEAKSGLATFPGGPSLISLQLINFILPCHRACLQEFSFLHKCVALQTQENIIRINTECT